MHRGLFVHAIAAFVDQSIYTAICRRRPQFRPRPKVDTMIETPRNRFAMKTAHFPRSCAALSCLLAIGGAACLPLTAGCGHESAASPVNRTVTPPVGDSPAEKGADVPASVSAEETASNSDASSASTAAAEPPSPLQTEAPSKTPPAGQRPPADRAPTRPGEAEKITWDDLNLGMQVDVGFRPFMLNENDRVKELEGRRISIIGYMHGGQAAQKGIKEFILLKNTQCKFGPGGQADHLANIVLQADHSTHFTPSPVKVEGTLKIAPFQGPDGNTWSIYRIDDAQIR